MYIDFDFPGFRFFIRNGVYLGSERNNISGFPNI